MATMMSLDWQAGVTLGIGLVALVYLLRRWWPSWRTPASAPTDACQAQGGSVSAPPAACGSGCGGCGTAQTPRRDHRITVQKPPMP